MRVLIVSHGHPDFSIGGAEVAAHNLFRAINATPGHEAHFLARAAAPLRRHGASALMSLRRGAREVFLHTDAWDPFWLSNGALDDLSFGFAQYLRHVQPDIVHFHHVLGLGVEALHQVRRTLPRARIVVTFHEYLSICHNHGQMVKAGTTNLCREASPAACSLCFPEHAPTALYQREVFLKHHLQLADRFISPSRFLIDRYTEWGLPGEKFAFIENGLQDRPAAPARTLPPGGRRDRFGFFGQITEFKGLHVLMDAIARVPDAVWGEANLSIFGGNLENQPEAFRSRFANLMEAAGRRARFYGPYRNEELPELMAEIDWTVVPSIWWENSPLVIQEAFQHQRPPIVTDIGGMREKVAHGVTGLRFRVASPESLADRLTEALTQPELWQTLRDGAPSAPGLPGYAAAHLSLYQDITGSAPAHRVVREAVRA